jgi:tripartite-type tricarboxylate transporter receptor subunit TctC
MKLPRRKFLRLAADVATMPAVSRFACAQAYPMRPVRIIVGVPPGGGIDIIARLIGQWLSERLHQPFLIENRPGAGTNIATEAVVRAPADGYTLLLVTAANAINATLYEKLNFSFIRDIAPVASIIVVPNVMLVNPSVPAKTIPEFVAFAKANPRKINIASGPIGGPSHVMAELFKMMTGTDMLVVPYRGVAPASASGQKFALPHCNFGTRSSPMSRHYRQGRRSSSTATVPHCVDDRHIAYCNRCAFVAGNQKWPP